MKIIPFVDSEMTAGEGLPLDQIYFDFANLWANSREMTPNGSGANVRKNSNF